MYQETKEDLTNIRSEKSHFKTEMKEFKIEIKEEFKKVHTRFMWSIGITVTMFSGLYLKLFLG